MATIGQVPGGGRPWGDIVTVQTPYTDQAINRLYQEQKMREAKQQQENQMLDAQFSKEIGKTRSIDQPDIIQKYQDYKQLKKLLLFNKKLEKDPIAYNQLQQQANLAYQDAMKTSSKSAELNELGKTLVQDRMKTPDNYEDDFGERISKFQNTPLSAGFKTVIGDQEVDLSNPDTYRYKGSNTDFQKIMQGAIGTPRQTTTTEETVGKEGLQTKITPYTFGNSPAQVRDNILAALGDRSNARSAAYQYDQLPPGEFEKTALAYSQIPKEKLKKMGLESVQDILPKTLDNKAANFASYKAMRYALDNEPTMGTPQLRENKEAVMNRQQKEWKIRADELFAQRKQLQDRALAAKEEGKEDEGGWINEYVGVLKDQSLGGPKIPFKYKNGTTVNEYDIPMDATLSKLLEKQKVQPDYLRYNPETKKFRPIYAKYETVKEKNSQGKDIDVTRIVKGNDGKFAVDETLSQPLSEPQLVLALGGRVTPTQRTVEMKRSIENEKSKSTTQPQPNRSEAEKSKQWNTIGDLQYERNGDEIKVKNIEQPDIPESVYKKEEGKWVHKSGPQDMFWGKDRNQDEFFKKVDNSRPSKNNPLKGTYKLNGKTYSKKALNDLGYDDDEIDQFIKGGLIQQ